MDPLDTLKAIRQIAEATDSNGTYSLTDPIDDAIAYIERLRAVEKDWRALGADTPGAMKLLLELGLDRDRELREKIKALAADPKRAAAERMAMVLKDTEWAIRSPLGAHCPTCGGSKQHGHDLNCDLRAALAAYGQMRIKGYRFNHCLLIRLDEGGDYVIRAVELPGCMAHGKTIDEALDNFHSMYELYLSDYGGAIPETMNEDQFLSLGKPK